MKKIKYLGFLLLLLVSSSCEDDLEELQRQEEKPVSPVVTEARDYFESYVEEVEMSMEMQGFYPGNFAPDWSKAVVTVDSYFYTTVNVPIVSDVVYEGTFASYYDAEEGSSQADYYTAVGQKMIVVKEPVTGAFGCYLVTIIPDEANATKSSHLAANMFDSGDESTAFSGTAFFTMLGNGDYGVAAGRYMNGERYAAASRWWVEDGNMQQLGDDLTGLLGVKKLYAKKKTMSKDLEYELPEFTVTAPAPTPPPSTAPKVSNGPPASTPTPPSSGSGGGGGGVAVGGGYGTGNTTSNSNSSTASAPAIAKVNGATKVVSVANCKFAQSYTEKLYQTPVQIGSTCGTAIMAFIDQLFGGNKTNEYFMNDFSNKYNQSILFEGFDGDPNKQFIPYVKEFFTTGNSELKTANDVKTVINEGQVIMANVTQLNLLENKAEHHQVAIVGYNNNNGKFIYMDTSQNYGGIYQNGSLYEADFSIFYYCFAITGRK